MRCNSYVVARSGSDFLDFKLDRFAYWFSGRDFLARQASNIDAEPEQIQALSPGLGLRGDSM